MKNLYVGASGVVWALDALRRRGHAETTLDLASAARRTLEAWRETPDYAQWDDVPSRAPAALLMGESGPLLAAWRVDPSAELADRLFARVRENADCEAVEIMWGAPGTMLAARAMLDWTGEERWADAWRESAEAVWERPRRRTGSGRTGSTARRSAASARRTVWSATSMRCAPAGSPTSGRDARTGDSGDVWNVWPAKRGARQLVEAGQRGRVTCASSGATVRRGSSRQRRRIWTRSCSWPAPSSPGRRARPEWRRAPPSATGRPGTATRSSRPSSAPVTSSGSTAPAGSPCTRSGRSPGAATGATRSGRETWSCSLRRRLPRGASRLPGGRPMS